MTADEATARAFLRESAPGLGVLMTTTGLADEIAAWGVDNPYDDSVGCTIVLRQLLRYERSAIGFARAWFDDIAFEQLLQEKGGLSAALEVIRFLVDCDVCLHQAGRECDIDEEDIEAGCAATLRLCARQRGEAARS